MNQSNVIIFNGESDHEIGKDFFFQDPQIQDLSPTEIVEIYHSTSVYYDVLKDIGNLIIAGVVKHVNDTKVDESYILKVEEGLSLLELMVNDTFGKEAAAMIFKQAQDTIEDSKKPD
tara:strand:+ start:1091 stop:1441 length:351 start_codon:yes stop_codon:yes gene_type:complete